MIEDLSRIRADALARGGKPDVPNRLDAWRRNNPNAMNTWTTKYGCVVAFGGMRIYYGRCKDCSGLVTLLRGDTKGRWPERCDDCRERKSEAHDNGARGRVARSRKAQYEHRAEQFAKAGLPPARQGVRLDGQPREYKCNECGEVECFCTRDD